MDEKRVHHVGIKGLRVFQLRDSFAHKGFEAYICEDGVHVHLRDSEIEIAKQIALKYLSLLKEGVLPSVEKAIQQGLVRIMEKNNV